MNGSTVPILMWIVNGLLGLAAGLIALIVKMHRDADVEHRSSVEKALGELKERIQRLEGMISR